MRLYLDASALVKLVQPERETAALRTYLRRHRDDDMVTSALSRTEVVRAVRAGWPVAAAHARRILSQTNQVPVDLATLDDAALLDAGGLVLRTLDAIHLASARLLGADLRAVVTYDARMAQAAQALGLVTARPAPAEL